MYFLSYGPFKFTLKSGQNEKFAVNHTLRWNNSNLITNWETILTLNNYIVGNKFGNYLKVSGATSQFGHGWL